MTACKPNRSRLRSWRLDTWLVSWEDGLRLFAVRVRTDPEGTITEAAPLVRRFIGQNLERLTAWVGYKQVRVDLVSSAKEKRDECYDRRQTG